MKPEEPKHPTARNSDVHSLIPDEVQEVRELIEEYTKEHSETPSLQTLVNKTDFTENTIEDALDLTLKESNHAMPYDTYKVRDEISSYNSLLKESGKELKRLARENLELNLWKEKHSQVLEQAKRTDEYWKVASELVQRNRLNIRDMRAKVSEWKRNDEDPAEIAKRSFGGVVNRDSAHQQNSTSITSDTLDKTSSTRASSLLETSRVAREILESSY